MSKFSLITIVIAYCGILFVCINNIKRSLSERGKKLRWYMLIAFSIVLLLIFSMFCLVFGIG